MSRSVDMESGLVEARGLVSARRMLQNSAARPGSAPGISPFVREAAMFNLFDILQAQAGANAQSFGGQFGLTQEQSLRAMQALLPALTMGLQRNAAHDPTGFAHLFNLVGPNPPTVTAPSPQMDLVVKQLFGSSHLSQAVLQQAATASGVAMPALKQMLPMMAGMVVAGIVHVMINQNPPPAPAPRSAPQAFGFPPNAWSELMDTFLRSGGLALPHAAPSPLPAAAPRPGTAPRATPAAKDKATGDAPFEMVQQMFQTGLDLQQENARAMQRLFDTFWQDPRGIGGTETDAAGKPGTGGPANSGSHSGRGRR